MPAGCNLYTRATGALPCGIILPMSLVKSIRVEYFALFREQRGIQAETLSTAAPDLRALYAELAKAHGFSLPVERVRVAVDDEFAEWDSAVPQDATVVFIPPVAGG